MYFSLQTKESVELAMQIKGKKVQNREIRIKRIETNKKNTNKVFDKRPLPFKRNKPMGKSGQNFQGETMKPKINKKVIIYFSFCTPEVMDTMSIFY